MSMLRLDQIIVAAIIAAMMVVPMMSASEESLNLVSLILIWGLFAVGFDLIFGMAGMLSFGHAAMFGTGGYALALLQVLYAYSGWENANYVLTEVRNAPTTLKRAAPIAIMIVTLLYVLANIAYVSRWGARMGRS